MKNTLINLSRFQKQLVLLFFDSVSLVVILLASFSIRLEYLYFPGIDIIWVILAAPVIAVPVFMRFGLYRAVIRYIGFRALWSIVQAVTLYALLWSMIGFMASVEGIPRSVILINWLLSIIIIGGSRMIGRWLLSEGKNQKMIRVIIYGAGSAGRQLSIALAHSTEYMPVAFVDDNAHLHRQSINGIEVFSRESIDHLIEQKKATEVLLAMPSISLSLSQIGAASRGISWVSMGPAPFPAPRRQPLGRMNDCRPGAQYPARTPGKVGSSTQCNARGIGDRPR